MYTHEFCKLQELLIIKCFSCNHKFGKYRWDGPHCAALWFVKLKQNPPCIRGNIFVLISYYFKTIIYFTGPEMTEQTFFYGPLSKSYFEPCILFVINLFTVCLFITLSHKGKFVRASEVISRVTKWKGEGGMIQNEGQFNCIRKKDNSIKKKISTINAERTLTIRVIQPGCKHTSSAFCINVSCKQV